MVIKTKVAERCEIVAGGGKTSQFQRGFCVFGTDVGRFGFGVGHLTMLFLKRNEKKKIKLKIKILMKMTISIQTNFKKQIFQL